MDLSNQTYFCCCGDLSSSKTSSSLFFNTLVIVQDGNGVVDLNEFIMGTVQYLRDQSHRSDIKHEAELASKHHDIGGSLDKVTTLLLLREGTAA